MQKQITLLFSILAFGLSILSCQAPSTENEAEANVPPLEAHEEALMNLLNDYIDAFNSGDVDAWLTTIADDAVFQPPNQPQVIGIEAIRSWATTSFFEPFNMHVSASHQELQIVEDWAFAYGSYTLSLTSKTDDQVIEDKGKYINIFQYQPNGSWKYAPSQL